MQYFNLILSDHAIKQGIERGVSKNDAWEAFNHPDETVKTASNKMKFRKYFNGYSATVLGAQNDKNEWVAVTIWRDPPIEGTRDARKKTRWQNYKNAGFWGKIWVSVKQQLGF